MSTAMNCDTFRSDIPLMLQLGFLAPDQQQHLDACDACRSMWLTSYDLWEQLEGDAASIRIPQDELRDEFRRRQQYRGADRTPSLRRSARNNVLSRGLVRMAAAIALLLFSFLAGRLTAGGERSSVDVAEIQSRLIRSQLLLPAPTARLEAIQLTESMVVLDDAVVQALLDAVREDPNINVRLAAIDALSRFVGDQQVRTGLEQSLPSQKSPLTQTILTEVLE